MENASGLTRQNRRTKAQIKVLLADYRNSNLSVAAFCSLRSLHRPTFHKWISRSKVLVKKQMPPAGFAAVEILSPTTSSLFAEVNGIKLYQPVTAAFLKLLSK